MKHWSVGVATIITTGVADIYHTQKGSTVHTISDFRELNKHIVRKPYPIPKISTILQELEGFTYATALDLNMGYYLHHQVGPNGIRDVYNHLPLEKVLI